MSPRWNDDGYLYNEPVPRAEHTRAEPLVRDFSYLVGLELGVRHDRIAGGIMATTLCFPFESREVACLVWFSSGF